MKLTNTYLLLKKKAIATTAAGAIMFQFGACNLQDVPFSTTLDARQLLTSIFRSLILSPIDAAVTEGIDRLVDQFDDQD